MPLSDFFRINLPYGIARNEAGEWAAFNREYKPLGFSDDYDEEHDIERYIGLPVFTFYSGVTEKFLLSIGWNEDEAIVRNKDGEIIKVYLYNDRLNPRNQANDDPALWQRYFDKLRLLSGMERKY